MLNSILTFAWLEQRPFGVLNGPTRYMNVEDGEGCDIRTVPERKTAYLSHRRENSYVIYNLYLSPDWSIELTYMVLKSPLDLDLFILFNYWFRGATSFKKRVK